jgi:hypothetical protein
MRGFWHYDENENAHFLDDISCRLVYSHGTAASADAAVTGAATLWTLMCLPASESSRPQER